MLLTQSGPGRQQAVPITHRLHHLGVQVRLQALEEVVDGQVETHLGVPLVVIRDGRDHVEVVAEVGLAVNGLHQVLVVQAVRGVVRNGQYRNKSMSFLKCWKGMLGTWVTYNIYPDRLEQKVENKGMTWVLFEEKKTLYRNCNNCGE
jgi:hypothetical protein